MLTFFSLLNCLLISFSISVNAAPSDFSGVPLLVQEVGPNNKIVSQFIDVLDKNEKSGSFEPLTTDLGGIRFFGMCLNADSTPCKGSYNLLARMKQAMATTGGRREADPKTVPPVPDMLVLTETIVIKEDSQSLKVQVTTKYFGLGEGSPTTFIISKSSSLASVKHTLQNPEKDEPNRKPILEVSDELKDLGTKVVMLQTDKDTGNMLGEGGRAQGTGYFISADGLLMTNHHVIDSFSECMKGYLCEVNFSQVKSDGTRTEFRAKVALLTMSQAHDFALLKVKIPLDVKISHFEFEKQEVGPDLLTLGFPADIEDGTPERKTRLTYSFGKLVGFRGQTYATSAFIYGGASGSPLLNAQTLKVVGILSNGAGNPIPGTGAPGIARPFYLTDAEYGISDYLVGQKQSRIKLLLKKIELAQNEVDAAPLMKAYLAEKTFYGLAAIKLLMVNHPSKKVRKEILRGLQEMTVLLGAKI